MIYESNNGLYHWGIKGMKWGVRRYQNKDGSLTEAGKRRMYKEMADLEGAGLKDRRKYTADERRWAKEDNEAARKVATASQDMTRNLKEFNRTTANMSSKKRMDLSNMTEKEMRDRINRELVERQYNEIFSPQKEARGREYVNRTLELAGSVLGVTASALGIALAIYDIKEKLG